MDPLSLIGGISATGAIVAACVKTLKSLSACYGRFGSADATLRLLITELTAIKAAVGSIEDWSTYSPKKTDTERELASAFKISFEGCKVAMEILSADLDSVTNTASKNPFAAKMKLVWDDDTMKDHADRLRAQVAALQLLIQAVRCNDAMEQRALLERPENRKTIQHVADDTSSITSRRSTIYQPLRSGSPTLTAISEWSATSSERQPDVAPASKNPFRSSKPQLVASKDPSPKKLQSASPAAAPADDTKHGFTSTTDWQHRGPEPLSSRNKDVDAGMRHRPLTVSSSLTKDSGYSSIYDSDADQINPAAYAKDVAASKARAATPVQRSASDPRPAAALPVSHVEMPQDTLLSPTVINEWVIDHPGPAAMPDIEPFVVPAPVREPGHRHHFSDDLAQLSPTRSRSGEIKRSLSGTIRKLTSRKSGILASGNNGAPSPGTGTPSRVLSKTVKRRGELKINESIDFRSKSGVSAPALVRAAQSNAIVQVEHLLEQRVDVEVKHAETGRTALAVAAHCGNHEIVALLLGHHARSDVRDADGLTPLHLSASRGHYASVTRLLEDNAEIDPTGPQLKTPLRLASDNGHYQVCELLLTRRAKVNARDSNMLTALHAAARIGDADLVELLIRYGADFEAKDAKMMTAMHYAAAEDYEAVVLSLLARKADMESLGDRGKTPLCCACEAGARETASLLISRKANVKHAADGGMTPLHWACQNDQTTTAELLLQQKRVVIDARNGVGRTPLHLAVLTKSFAATDLLLRKGADYEAQCSHLYRPLHYAASNGGLMIVQFLLGLPVDFEAPGPSGCRPIHLACMNGYDQVVRTLIQRGAQVDARDGNKDRPLSLACERGQLEVVKVLLDSGSALQLRTPLSTSPSLEDSPLCRAAKNGHLDVVCELIRRGASVRQHDEHKWQPLRYATFFGHATVVSELLRQGAPLMPNTLAEDPNAVSAAGAIQFADGVDSLRKQQVSELLYEKRLTMPRRVLDDDPYLTLSVPDRSGGSQVKQIYEVGGT